MDMRGESRIGLIRVFIAVSGRVFILLSGVGQVTMLGLWRVSAAKAMRRNSLRSLTPYVMIGLPNY